MPRISFKNMKLETIRVSFFILMITFESISCAWPTGFPKFPKFGQYENGAVSVTTGVDEAKEVAMINAPGQIEYFHAARFIAFMMTKNANETYNPLCSASILDEYHILTSGFCCTEYDRYMDDIAKVNNRFYIVYGGATNPEFNKRFFRKVKEVKLHPRYFEGIGVYPNRIIFDYCVAVLETPIEFIDGVKPIKLAPAVSPARKFYEDKLDKNDCWNIGFGRGHNQNRRPYDPQNYLRLKKIQWNRNWPESDIEAFRLEISLRGNNWSDEYVPFISDYGSPLLCRLKSLPKTEDYNDNYITVAVLKGEQAGYYGGTHAAVYEPVALVREWIDGTVLNESEKGLYQWAFQGVVIILLVFLILSVIILITRFSIKANITTEKTTKKVKNSLEDDGATTTTSMSSTISKQK